MRNFVYREWADEGGQQERALAARYRQSEEALASSFPRTAAVLRQIAARYDQHATEEDNESAMSEYD